MISVLAKLVHNPGSRVLHTPLPVATNYRWCQEQNPTASLAAVTGPKAKRQKMQKKKERNEQTKAQIGNGSCMCKMSALLSFSALSLSRCVTVRLHCSVRLDSLRFLLNWNWQPLAFACCVCAKMTVNMPGQGHFLPLCPHSLQLDFCKWEFQFYDRLHSAQLLAIFIHSLIQLFMHSFIHTYSHLQPTKWGGGVAAIVKCCCLIRWSP